VKNSARTARVVVSADGRGLVSQAGAVLLWETMRVTGLGRGLSTGLDRWRAPRAVHDPGKIVADLAAAVALGGDCLANIAVRREQPELAGPVASDPVASRLVSALAADLPRALKAIRSARAAARERAWALAGENAPGADGGLVAIDLDATIVIAHSERAGRADLEEDVGFSPDDRLRRPWSQRKRGAAGLRAEGRKRRVEHGRRPYRGRPAGPGTAPAPPAAEGAGPGRLRRRHARVPGLADRQVPAAALFRRHDHQRGHAGRNPQGPGRSLDARL
jgi:Transposase DDE domain group 1